MRKLATLLFTLAATVATTVQALDLPIRVGRVAHIDGRVSLYQDPDEGWERAYVNSPITSENSVWTDNDGRAELRISGMALRLDELTQLDIARLGETELDAFVARGTLAVRVRHFESGERLTFNTPNARVRIRANGRYRIDVDPDRLETRITVFVGEVRVGTDEGRMRIGAGRSVLVFGSDPPEFVEERAASGAFDRWTLARDQRWREGRASTYVSTYMTGYEDLDAYGDWATEPDYGVLWYPRGVAANWAPYRHGRWDYVRPWGWTWIDDAPWGYAPFHYGRWVYVRDRWAWHAGERVARPAWAPALVAWIGGSNFNVRVASGGPAVGWYPLSPWDRYDPWFQASPTYVNRVNLAVRRDEPTRVDSRQWRDWTRERGTTVVERSVLADGRPIAAAALPMTIDAIRQAQVAPRAETMLPSRADVLGRRRAQPETAAPAPTVAQQPGQPVQLGQPAQGVTERSAIVRPDFGRRVVAPTPQAATAPPPAATIDSRSRATPQVQERAVREAQQQQEGAARDAQQQQQQQRQAQERAQREAQQQQERAVREAQQQQEKAQRDTQQQQQQQRQAQEKAQREAQQQQQVQERAVREAQQQQQAQEKAQREAQQFQQAQEKAQREAQQQQQQQRQAQEKAQREAQQQQQVQERAVREAQQLQQAQEKAQREAQQLQQQQRQAQEKAQREAQQFQQAQEKAQREAQQQLQAQEKAQRDTKQVQERAATQSRQQKAREKDEEDEKEKEKEKQKGKGKGP